MGEVHDRDGMTEVVSGPRTKRVLLGGLVVGLLFACGCVAVVVGFFRSDLLARTNEAIADSEVAACSGNLRHIYHGIILYETKHGELPDGSGAGFLAQLWTAEVFAHTRTEAERLTCPAVDLGSLALSERSWEEWWSDPEAVDGNFTAYAARDQVRFPLTTLGAEEPLVACDNDPCMNHPDATNVLYADGSVKSFSVAELRRKGILGEDDDLLPVGPDSPLEDLQKLSLD